MSKLKPHHPKWKKWVAPGRIFPLLTIIGAGVANILALLGIVSLSFSEGIIVALLALLAIDALAERINVLERIESKLNDSSAVQTLQPRANILRPTEHAQHAKEICILSFNASTALTPHIHFYKHKLEDGCKIRVILPDPKSSLNALTSMRRSDTSLKMQIELALGFINDLNNQANTKNRIDVCCVPIFLPYSMFAVDMNQNKGSMIVEYLSYKASIDDRPHVHLTKAESPYWFEYYRQQFETVWNDYYKGN